MVDSSQKKYAKKIFDLLGKEYPAVRPALEYSSPFQLLISTILSAQCTDERVNIVTMKLFKKYKKPEDYLKVSAKELEKDIFSTGFYRQKAKSIRNCCAQLIEYHNGKVPKDFDALTKLSGVGRKTAEKIILELRDKMGELSHAEGVMFREEQDVLEALQSLGYSKTEVREALKNLPAETKGTNNRIKEALKTLGRKF
jgi:3-methyladenine DNA glycosylase/8-oxoguanine DNA glycosylase